MPHTPAPPEVELLSLLTVLCRVVRRDAKRLHDRLERLERMSLPSRRTVAAGVALQLRDAVRSLSDAVHHMREFAVRMQGVQTRLLE